MLYELHPQLTPTAQRALYRQPLEQILEQPAPCLQQWVQTGYKYFNQQAKAAKKQAALNTPDIRMFFCHPTQQNDDLHPLGSPVNKAPVWVFFVRNSLRVITLKMLSFFLQRCLHGML